MLADIKKYKRVIQLEFNEISLEAIQQLIHKQNCLPNFARIFREWKFLQTSSEIEYQNVEPWIQWVTAHTGKTLAEHKIFRLSDVHQLQHPQIWEQLNSRGIEAGIIGSMNTTRGNVQGGIFFPDPWAQTNQTYPEELKPLWELIASKVQHHATAKLSLRDLGKALRICNNLGLPLSLYWQIFKQLLKQKVAAKTKWRMAGIFDLFLAEIFKSVLKSTNFGFYTLFLNSIAHYQHHYWRAFDNSPFSPDIKYSDIRAQDNPMLYGYQIFDKILGDTLSFLDKNPDTLVLVLSGLTQVPYTEQEEQGGMNYYRLNNHAEFARQLGLNGQVFPMMSRDWQYQYLNPEDREITLTKLKALSVAGQALFAISECTPGYLYIETAYTAGIGENSEIYQGAKPWQNFNICFTNIAVKSGHHSGVGNLWISDPRICAGQTIIPLTLVHDIGLQALSGNMH